MASKLKVVETLRAKVAALKIQSQTYQPFASTTIGPRDKKRRKMDQGNREQQLNNWPSDNYDDAQPWWKRNPIHHPLKKIGFPKFDYGDPRGLIFKAEKYFHYCQTPEKLKVDITMMYLETDWYRSRISSRVRKKVNSSNNFAQLFMLRVFLNGSKEDLKDLSLLEATEEGDEQDTYSTEVDNLQQNDLATLSFHAILGKIKTTIMKLREDIETKEVPILIDSGSTHNFIADTPIVKELNLKTQILPSFGVQTGNKNIIRCNYVCRNVEI
ncbi:hypothetical protein Gotri_021568 [Gossypium trilobum]|uniref:Uncharacterized protein n=1 Tax=Gossypium trilobum TaxID=34281 RepID=A0A7J9DCX3_9ROSI|nr:hypothetical protein [Gossypium trilobum]